MNPEGNSSLAAVVVVVVASFLYYCLSLFHNSNSSTYYQTDDIIRAISGSVGSAFSITLLYPLETVRTRLQVDTSITPHSSLLLIRTIAKEEGGFRGLYRGWFSLVVALMTLNFVYFYCFHSMRRLVMDAGEWNQVVAGWRRSGDGSMNKWHLQIDLISGYMAGVVAVLFTAPLWLVNTRLKLQGVNHHGATEKHYNRQYTGILQCMYLIGKEEGVLTLWHGTFTSIILALNPAIQMGVYEMLKRHHLIIGVIEDSENGSRGGLLVEPFLNALLSKFIATVITYPIQLIQTRHRAGMKKAEVMPDIQSKKKSFWIHLQSLTKLYRGLESKLLQTCLNSALMFVAYERLVGFLATLLDNEWQNTS